MSITQSGRFGTVCDRIATSTTLSCAAYAAATWTRPITIGASPSGRTITNADNGATVHLPLEGIAAIDLGTPAGTVVEFPAGADNPANDRDATGWQTPAIGKPGVLTFIGSPAPRPCQQHRLACTAWRATAIGQTTLTFAGPNFCYLPCDPLHPVLVPLSFSVTIDVG